MDRKEFIKTCGGACLGALGFGILPSGCGTAKMVNATVEEEFLIVPLSDFETGKEGAAKFRPYVIAQNSNLSHPIYVRRLGEVEYAAVLMRCTHQGTELQAFGDKLQCPAHGSVFDNNGTVKNGPAIKDLRIFPVTVNNQQLKISLK